MTFMGRNDGNPRSAGLELAPGRNAGSLPAGTRFDPLSAGSRRANGRWPFGAGSAKAGRPKYTCPSAAAAAAPVGVESPGDPTKTNLSAPHPPAKANLGLGCVTFGREIDRAAAFTMMDHALARGITVFDTAAAYGAGASETIVGEWLRSREARP